MWIAETQDDEIDKFFSSAKKTNDMQPRRKYVRGEKLLSRLFFVVLSLEPQAALRVV